MKNFFIYLLIMGITLYGMIMYNQPSLMIVFIFELLMLLMSAALIVYLRFKISSELILPIQRVKKGEPLMMEIQMKNTSFLPVQRLKVNLDYHYNFSKKRHRIVLSESIDGKSEARLRCQILPEYCGCLTVNHIVIKVFDFLNIFNFSNKVNEVFKIAVFPDLYPTDITISRQNRNFLPDSDTYAKDKSGDDPSEIFKIREYAVGDRLQNIHWKLTARKGLAMVKEFSRPIGCNAIFLLDIRKEEFPAEHLWEITFAIAYGLLEAECYFYLSWIEGHSKEIVRRMIDDVESLYEAMEELICMNISGYDKSIDEIYQETYSGDAQNVRLVLDTSLNLYHNGNIIYAFDDEAIEDSLSGLHLVI